jgi:tetratricopeptide (TPR) repeat protein
MLIHRLVSSLLALMCLVLSATASAQTGYRYQDTTSMDILASDNTPARECYQAASIAARIHYTSRKDVETCTYALQRTALTPRDRAATLANRGIIYMSLEDYQKAIQDYSAALTLKPEFGELNVNIGNVYFLGKAYDKALIEYTTAIEKQTSKPQIAYFNRGMTYEGMGKFAEAEADYRMALQLFPDWAAAQSKLDELLQKAKNPASSQANP